MSKFCYVILVLQLPALDANIARPQPDRVKLQLTQTYPVEGIVDPSGLTIHDGRLLTISDKQDDTIYELKLEGGSCKTQTYRGFQTKVGEIGYDFEGITSHQSRLYLLSETRKAVFQITANGDLREAMDFSKFDVGSLFEKRGAGPEGLAMLGERFAITSEREPAGLLITGGTTFETVNFEDNKRYPKSKAAHRPKDATGLWVDGEELWCLSRNAETITRLDLAQKHMPISGVYSFESSGFRYEDDKYGTAEGLAADAEFIYIILDNNRLPTRSDRKDTRARLLVFKRPDSKKDH